MGIVNFSIPKELVKQIIVQTPFTNFIETGTYRGATSFWAAGFFPQVYTIEVDPQISKETAAVPGRPKNIEFLVGNSRDVLPGLVPRLNGRSFFWLDGHWCFGAGGKEEECPLLDELHAIRHCKDSVIFIDDARCFLGPLPSPHNAEDWPSIDTIFAVLKELFPTNRTTIIDDVLISIPSDIKPMVDRYWQQTFYDRFDASKGYIKLAKRFVKKLRSKS